ncbi:hypothetical protein Tco_0123240 [Tanacetum coccineum]
MKRVSRGYSRVDIPLFPTMINAPKTSPSRITSSPSLSPQTHPYTSQPQTTPVAEETTPLPHESPLQSFHLLGRDEGSLSLHELMALCTKLSKKVESLESELKQTKQTYSSALTKLIKRVKKLEEIIKTSKAKRRAKIVISEDEDAEADSSKQGRKISDIDKDPTISFLQDEGMTCDDTEVLLEEEEPTKLIEDQGSGEKGEKEVTTADIALNTANASISTISAPRVYTTEDISGAAETLVYIRRSAEKRKDKGKSIMQEFEPLKKIKKKEMIQISLDEEFAKSFYEEEKAQILQDEEYANQVEA